MSGGENGTISKYINIKTILTMIFLAWIYWVTNSTIEAKVDQANLCNIAQDLTELKQDVKKIKEHFFIP